MRALLAAVALAACLAVAPDASAAPAVRHGCTSSVPERGSDWPVDICWTLFRPADADASHKVPLLFESQGGVTVSPFSDASFGHGSRTPNAVVLDHVVVHLPVV